MNRRLCFLPGVESNRNPAPATGIIIALIALFIVACSGRQPTTSSAISVGFQAIVDRYFDENARWWPVSASAQGDHRYDGQWPDVSASARTRYSAWLATMDEALTVPRESLSVEQRVDLEILVNRIKLHRMVERGERPWETNPLNYTYLIGGGLEMLVDRAYAPIAARGAALAERLEGVPKLVAQAIDNMSDPRALKAPHTKVAITQLAGMKALFEDRIPERTSKAPTEVRARIDAALPVAWASVQKLRKFLDAGYPAAKGPWRLGKQLFSEKLGLALHTTLTADEVYDLAQKEHIAVRKRMYALARDLYEPLFGTPAPAIADASPGTVIDGVDHSLIAKVLDALAADHGDAAGLRDACEENLQRITNFVRKQNIVPLDDSEVLEVIWTPPHRRGVAVAGLDAPAPLDADTPGLPSYYLVQPIPEAWSAEERESQLREYNHFMLEILSIHEAIPGHFVQLYYGKRDPSKVRKLYGNGAFSEGWAVYTEKVMVDAGYVGQTVNNPPDNIPEAQRGLWRVKTDDQLRAKAIALHGQKFFLRTVTNAIIDHEIHVGSMTREQAISLMMDRAFQEQGEARGKWVRAQVSSTQLSTYFVGSADWFRLRAQAEKRATDAGEPFDMAVFHREALSHGSPPMSLLPALMGWQ